jgi:hypothetical protein
MPSTGSTSRRVQPGHESRSRGDSGDKRGEYYVKLLDLAMSKTVVGTNTLFVTSDNAVLRIQLP